MSSSDSKAMKNKLTIASILGATVLVAGLFAFMPVEKASTASPGPKHDFALLNTSDTDVRCKSAKPMTVYITMTNDGSAGSVNVEFFEPDGTFNDDFHFPIAAGETISLAHATHNTQSSGPVADAEIVVRETSGADLRGWISAQTHGEPQYDTDGDLTNDSFCTTT